MNAVYYRTMEYIFTSPQVQLVIVTTVQKANVWYEIALVLNGLIQDFNASAFRTFLKNLSCAYSKITIFSVCSIREY